MKWGDCPRKIVDTAKAYIESFKASGDETEICDVESQRILERIRECWFT